MTTPIVIPLVAALGQLQYIQSSPIDIVNGASILFTVTGQIAIVRIRGTVTEAISATATNLRVTASQAGFEQGACANRDVQGFTTANRVWITGNPAAPLQANDVGMAIRSDYGMHECDGSPGYIWARADATPAAGAIRWELNWIALSPGASVVAA